MSREELLVRLNSLYDELEYETDEKILKEIKRIIKRIEKELEEEE